jgi:hypothetical protein
VLHCCSPLCLVVFFSMLHYCFPLHVKLLFYSLCHIVALFFMSC